MKFANIGALHLLWPVMGVVVFYYLAGKKRRKRMEDFADKGLLSELASSLDSGRQRLKFYIILTALIFAVFSLTRPQWGFHWQEIKRKGLDIVIAIDTSKSMLAEDVKPNRLERSKLAVQDFVKNLKGDRTGLIAFSGNAFLQCPLTVDYKGFLLSVNALSTNTIPKGGTSISGAIKEAMRSFEGGLKKYKVLILITDGEDHKGNPEKIAEQAKKEGVKIFSIGIGTGEGELIPVTDEEGNRMYLKDRQGNVVKSRLDETTLQKIALATGGSYVKASSTEFGLELIYKEKLSKMEKRELKSKMAKQYEERFQLFLLAAVLLLITELFISERRKE